MWFSVRQRFLRYNNKSIPIIEQIDKLDFVIATPSAFKKAKQTLVKRMERQDTDWEKIFAYYVFDKGLKPRICFLNSQNSIVGKQTTALKQAKRFEQTLHQRRPKDGK